MKEIKFRVYDWAGKRMLDEHTSNLNLFHRWLREPETYSVMQFTGLKDKNGKEIYEGDIVRHPKLDRPEDGTMFGLQEIVMGGQPREVKFEAGGFTPLAGWIDDAIKDMQWEVIGNIYENPELLR